MNASALSTRSAASAAPARSDHQAERRDAMKTLVKDVKSGDLDGAKAAYAALTKNIPTKLLSNPKSAIGQLGAALNAGDVDASKTALAKVAVKAHDIREATAGPSANPVRAPVTSSTGGTAGTVVNLVA